MINYMEAKNEILTKFRQNKGFICSDDMPKSAYTYHIGKMLESNQISRLKRGIYILNGHEHFDERVLISKMIPDAVFCLFSAWEYYQLITSIPVKHYLALSRNTKIKKFSFPPVQLHYWNDTSFNTGITEVEIDQNKVRIYDMERSVCNAIKHRAKVGEDITLEVVKNYIRNKNTNMDKLMKYAALLRISKTTEQYLKPLV